MDLGDKMSWCGASSNALAHIGSLAQSVSGMLVCHVSERAGGRSEMQRARLKVAPRVSSRWPQCQSGHLETLCTHFWCTPDLLPADSRTHTTTSTTTRAKSMLASITKDAAWDAAALVFLPLDAFGLNFCVPWPRILFRVLLFPPWCQVWCFGASCKVHYCPISSRGLLRFLKDAAASHSFGQRLRMTPFIITAMQFHVPLQIISL